MMLVPKIVHILQLESYNNKDYTRWLGKNFKIAFKPGLKQLIFVTAYLVFMIITNLVIGTFWPSFLDNIYLILVENFGLFILFYIVNFLQVMQDKKLRKTAKKKLVYTARAKRLMFWNFILMILVEASYTIDWINYSAGTISQFEGRLIIYTILIFLIPFNVAIANFFAWPTERAIADNYIFLAKIKLWKKAYKKLIKIGITGSYGKTSTKFILKTILSEKYNVLASPESYNTSMGNVRVIREMLKPEHEVLIAEMGARYKGDIREICDFVNPQIAMITSIGPQHLESFKTIENVQKAKAEIINALPYNGTVFLPKDNPYCMQLYNKETREKFCYSVSDKNADIYAKNIELNENGSSFIAVTPIGEINCKTKLLGEHNILNILGAISIAIHLKLSKEEISRGVEKIESIPHRLQIINNGNNIVIDDAFNSNPVGSKMAIDVLRTI